MALPSFCSFATVFRLGRISSARRLLLTALITAAFGLGCGDGQNGSSGGAGAGNDADGSGNTGSSDGKNGDEMGGPADCKDEPCDAGTPFEPRPDGCIAPPEPTLDPTISYTWEAPPADLVATSADDSGAGSLRDALEKADDGDVIGFDESLAGKTILLDEQLVVTSSLTIDASAAPGVTLDAQQNDRVVLVENDVDTVFVGLTFVNGKTTSEGGGVKVDQANEGKPERSTEFIGCRFENNAGLGGALLIGWRVGAVVRDSIFVGNDGTSGSDGKSGGAISTRQDAHAGLLVERSVFRDNVGHKCGAVYNILEPLVVEDSVFSNNRSIDGAGAIFSDGGNTVGPANDEKTGEDGQMTLRRLWVEENEGQGEGGAIMLWGYPRDVIVLESSVIKNNSVAVGGKFDNSKGGGARLHGLADMLIRNSYFEGNAAVQQGGALWIDGSGDLLLENTLFFDNTVEKDTGGAFTYNARGTKVTINACGFVNNFAGRACGAFWWASKDQDITVSNSYFVDNDSKDKSQRHTRSPRPKDGGGNLEWVSGDPNKGRLFEDGSFEDPALGAPTLEGGLFVLPLSEDSALHDAANDSAPDKDMRGAPRGDKPDIGPYELGAGCQ